MATAHHSWKSASQSFLETDPRQENQAVELSGSQATATRVPSFSLAIVIEPGAIVLLPLCKAIKKHVRYAQVCNTPDASAIGLAPSYSIPQDSDPC